ncbi:MULTISPECIES: ABC transporter substrate-binding protein [unclassified Novosphingobium]|uniref:ABC transporter substrate-binding protein n=1 Tax=unclassified Novosphingobium TaxID=2644732 RepID=UPI000EC08906|nr:MULTISPECIES: ABC transporter substrate-binding protein [unclassified Novosphingobium]HCF24601.1 ABC transporter substrate-binding protein [Novosphingobium sp.]HQV04267.1 ABC transporter substrate-binding protein [Novosphingobium sp.]
MVLRRKSLALVPLALALSGCFGDDDRPVEVAVIGPSAGAFMPGPRLPLAAQLMRGATIEGLVGFDEQGRVVPALADRWIVTDDGLSFIFRLRDGTWPDGSEISGESARLALARAMAAQRGTALGQDLGVIAEVRAMAGRVIEIRLSSRQPELLQVLAQPELGLTNRNRGAGPMRLRREKDSALLRPIPPLDRGMPQDERWTNRARRLELVSLPAKTAIEKFNTGDVDLVLGGTLADFPRLDAMGVARGAIRLDPVGGLFGLATVHEDGFLGKTENREAVAMAIDRQALVGAVNLAGWVTTTRVVNPGLAEDNGTIGERWSGRSLEERRALASSRVAEWKQGGRSVQLRIGLPSGPGADALFVRLQQDLKLIGIETLRVGIDADADLRLVDAVASYGSAFWFFNRLSCASQPAGCSPAADKLVAEALMEADPAKRAELVSQAEAQITVANGYIPLGVPIRWSLVSGSVSGFEPNRLAVHPLMSLAMLPK